MADEIWKKQADKIYEEKLDLKNPDFLQYNQLRYYIQRYVLKSLQEAKEKSAEEQDNFLKFMVPFNSIEDFNSMISHFFFIRNLEESESGQLSFFKDPYVQECFILSDLLKVRKTIEIMEWMVKRIEGGKSFKSTIKSDDKKISILKSCRRVMKMAFIQCIKPEFQSSMYKEINPDFITIENIDKRKKKHLEYSWNSVLKGERYRRIFLHLLFRMFIQTKLKGKPLDFEYNFIQFEQLKREFFTEWLIKLGDNPIKKALIEKLKQENRLLLKQMLDEEILKTLNTSDFNDFVAEINSQLPEELKSPIEPLSSKHGTLKDVKANLLEIKDAINREAMLTTSVERMTDVLKSISSLSNCDSKNNLSQLLKSQENKANSDDTVQQEEFDLVMSDFVMSGSINLLIVIPSQFKEGYEPILEKACKQAKVGSWKITTEKEIDQSQLTQSSLVLFFRVNANSIKQNLELEFSELIGIDVYDFHVDPDKVIQAFVQSVDESTTTHNISQIKSQLDLEELEKYTDNLLKNPYAVFEENWMIRTRLMTLEKFKNNISISFSQMINVTKWIISEGLVAAGHLQSLTKTLASIDKILIIYSGIETPSTIGLNSVNVPKNWEIWGEEALKKSMHSLPDSESLMIGDFFSNTILEKYEMVIVFDLLNTTEDQFLVHVGIKELLSTGKETLRHQLFVFNLYLIFKYQRFLERCNYVLKKYDLATSDVTMDADSIWKLAENTRGYLELDSTPQQSKGRKQQTRWTNKEALELDLINRIARKPAFTFK